MYCIRFITYRSNISLSLGTALIDTIVSRPHGHRFLWTSDVTISLVSALVDTTVCVSPATQTLISLDKCGHRMEIFTTASEDLVLSRQPMGNNVASNVKQKKLSLRTSGGELEWGAPVYG